MIMYVVRLGRSICLLDSARALSLSLSQSYPTQSTIHNQTRAPRKEKDNTNARMQRNAYTQSISTSISMLVANLV